MYESNGLILWPHDCSYLFPIGSRERLGDKVYNDKQFICRTQIIITDQIDSKVMYSKYVYKLIKRQKK